MKTLKRYLRSGMRIKMDSGNTVTEAKDPERCDLSTVPL